MDEPVVTVTAREFHAVLHEGSLHGIYPSREDAEAAVESEVACLLAKYPKLEEDDLRPDFEVHRCEVEVSPEPARPRIGWALSI